MNTEQLDIEIYVKDTSISDIAAWLGQHFEFQVICNFQEKIQSIDLNYLGNVVEVMITPKAAGKAYTSIWFKSDKTPWSSDLLCANNFLQQFDTEVRCSAESWQESEAEYSEKWWKLTRDTKELVSWG